MARPRTSLNVTLALLLISVPAMLLALRLDVLAPYKQHLLANLLISAAGFFLTFKIIPHTMVKNRKAGLFGIDINKCSAEDFGQLKKQRELGTLDNKYKVPEALGLVSGTVFLMCLILFELFNPCPLAEYNAALTTLLFMLLLGFTDDVLDLRWRYKLIMPSVAAVPLLVAYTGITVVVVPGPLRSLLGSEVDLGLLYYLYMGLLAVFCSNAINIYAGVNGLEAGQSLVIAVAIMVHNLIEVAGRTGAIGGAGGGVQLNHLLSLFFEMPFAATTLALLYYNWHPSAVFVGDTFTNFAGMNFAVVAILGHFGKTLLLFFIPQILNFLVSLPQVLNLLSEPCPRHRLPKYNASTGKLERNPKNWTLINMVLWIIGPTTEQNLVVVLMVLQVACCAVGFGIRYGVAGLLY